MNQKHNYDESKVQTLSSLDHIRLRTGMYIGRLGNGSDADDGIYIMLKEIVDNSVDNSFILFFQFSEIAFTDFLGPVIECFRFLPYFITI